MRRRHIVMGHRWSSPDARRVKMDKLFRGALALLLLVTGTFAITAVACGDDDKVGKGVEVVASAEPDPEADPYPEADPEAAPEITPGPKPDAATQVNVTLAEFEITTDATSVPAGQVYFLVENEGPADAHEF